MSGFWLLLVVTTLKMAAVRGDGDGYGDVSFDTSCSATVQADFNTALSMMYVVKFMTTHRIIILLRVWLFCVLSSLSARGLCYHQCIPLSLYVCLCVCLRYSFWYTESLILFDDILTRDPQCCMVSESERGRDKTEIDVGLMRKR